MPPIRRDCCLAVIGSLLLGVTGCGGGVPTTGETVDLRRRPEVVEAGKKMINEFMEKGPQPKGRAKAKK